MFLAKEGNLGGLGVLVKYKNEIFELNYIEYIYDNEIVGDWLFYGSRENSTSIIGFSLATLVKEINSNTAELFEELLFSDFNLREKVLQELLTNNN